MKKLLFTLSIMALALGLVACGDDNDEPVVEKSQRIESYYESESDVHYLFDIDLEADSSSIYCYNVTFTIGDRKSPALNIRIDAPVSVTVNSAGSIYTYTTAAGTSTIPYIIMGTTAVPMAEYAVTNLTCMVNTRDRTYRISFNCHGGEYSDSGDLNLR